MKKNSNLKFKLPTILIILIPALIIALCFIFGKTDQGTSLYSEDAKIDWSKYSEESYELSSSLKITEPGIYNLTGTIEDGMIEVETSGTVKLILNNVSISNSKGPAILIWSAKTTVIELADGSENYLSDGSIYSGYDEDICAALFSKDDLVLQGSGKLTVDGNYDDGIVGKDDLKINSGTYIVTAKDDGIRGRDSVYIVDGEFDITSGADGIKSNNDSEVGKGTIYIENGNIKISAGDDGIHGETSLTVKGGTINIEKSYEGLEAAKVIIDGGDIKIKSSDDGINAAGGADSSSPNSGNYNKFSNSGNYTLEINAGNIYINAGGDGVDSNGTITFNGGTTIVDGPSDNGNSAVDSETGIYYNSGDLIALGSSGMVDTPKEISSGNVLSVYFASSLSAGTKVSLKTASGETILETASAKTFNHTLLASSKLSLGETYLIYVNDEKYEEVNLNSNITTVGTATNNMMNGGGMNFQGGGFNRQR